MAPGARPVAEKKAEGAEGAKREPRERPEGAPKTKRYGRTTEGAPTRSARKFDPDRKGPARGRPGDDRADKPRILKTRDEDGEWIRASEPEQRDEGRGGFGRKRSGAGDDRSSRDFGDRPPRGDRAFGDRKPRSEGERSFGDRPARGDRKPRAEGERTFSDRPPRRDGGKPFGGKPGGKSFGGKPGGRPAGGGKPGGRPGGARPAGGSRPRGKGK